jgi:hypothetical protein
MTYLEKDEIILQLKARIKELETAQDELAIASFNVIKYVYNKNKLV